MANKIAAAAGIIVFGAAVYAVTYFGFGKPATNRLGEQRPTPAASMDAADVHPTTLQYASVSNQGLDPPEDIGGSKPPLFKPSMPPSWTWHQMQVATQALNALFDACPHLSTWLPDMWKADIHVDKSIPQTVNYDRKLFAPLGWTNPLVVQILTVPHPHNPMFGGDATAVEIYLGTGKRTGIFMPGGEFPLAVCGGKPTYTWRTDLDQSSDKTEESDTFIAAPALKVLKNF